MSIPMHDHQPARSGALFVGKYDLLRPDRACGMAQVWLAHKERLGGIKRACAIKMLTDLIGASALQRTAILNEARADRGRADGAAAGGRVGEVTKCDERQLEPN